VEATPIPNYRIDEFSEAVKGTPDLLLHHPCLVRGFTAQWQASQRWTSFDYLTQLFGKQPVTAGAPQFTTQKHTRMCQVSTDFGTYLRYVQDPDSFEILFKDKWSRGDAASFRELELPLYCGNLRIARHSREGVFLDIDPAVPPPLEYLNSEIPYYYQCGNHLWLYVSLTGALTPLHQDNNSVFSYLAQLQGSKRAILYSPLDKPHFHNPSVGYLDPLNPNESEFPTWREARPWSAVLNPGELLLWGPDWAHHVVTLARSITVSFDFVNFYNLDAYSRSVDWRFELGRFAKKNADWIRERIQDERIRRALESGREEDLGRDIMLRVLCSALQSRSDSRACRVKERMLAALLEAPQNAGAPSRLRA
jgi:hypothetical protein